MMLQSTLAWILAILTPLWAMAEEPVGRRPYEMDWAGRTKAPRPAAVDFENLEGWTVETHGSKATFTRSREQQLWGKYVGKLVYRATDNHPRVTLRPPEPIALPQDFDCVNFWLYGNNWAWISDHSTPRVTVWVLLRGRDGRETRVAMAQVRWREWWLMHRRLSPEQRDIVSKGASFEGIEITGGKNREDRCLYFDNISFYKEMLAPLQFEPRPRRNLVLPEGQTTGTNTGPGTLPFPTRPETILPTNLTEDFSIHVEPDDKGFAFHYRGADGHLVYRYLPQTGTLGDLTAWWEDAGGTFHPLADGGLRFVVEGKSEFSEPEKAELVTCEKKGTEVRAIWKYHVAGQTHEVTYSFHLWQKSLVVDVQCLGSHVGEFRFGRVVGVENPRFVTVPYLTGHGQNRPAVVISGPPERPLFIFPQIDHCRSNASLLWFVNGKERDGIVCNGGSRYLPKTDGKRNPCFERFFLTVSPRFEEVLPNIPNPKSPWMHVAGERLWHAHGASDRARDYAIWKEIARYGMTKVVITDHETGWRDGGESFTLRTRAAPGKGGDEDQADYARKIRALGFRYGIYNNYTDFAPVNGHWDEDLVTRRWDGEWQTAWARCYNPKPARAVELEARLAPVIQKKFQLDTAYCDVHTAVTPWSYVDYDARVPGAATFAATFYAYGEIMLHQKKTWNGPVYSEGNNHWYYCGLTDGNYGQDQAAGLDEAPWLVDFDLRKMHPLCCNFGMGNWNMFYGQYRGKSLSAAQQNAMLDRFLAATLAFGHTGFLVRRGGIENTVRSYFTLQQIHARYARQEVDSIRYAGAKGRLLDTTTAVASGAFRRSQIVTRWPDGLEVIVNGHPSESWKFAGETLPPGGWVVRDPIQKKLVAKSVLNEGHRVDYVDSPAYVYADGRGRFTRFEKAASDGQLIAHRRDDGTLEVIPVGRCASFGIGLNGRSASAVALDRDRKPLGPAETRLSRGLVYIMPKDGAFSYVLTPQSVPEITLRCERERVVPGERVRVIGCEEHVFQVPAETQPDTRLWKSFEGAWIDFTVVPLVETHLRLGEGLSLRIVPHMTAPVEAQVAFDGHSKTVRLEPEKPLDLVFPWTKPTKELVRPIKLSLKANNLAHQQTWWLKSERERRTLVPWPNTFEQGHRLRDAKEQLRESGAAYRAERTCGGVSKEGLFMHPPYENGVGAAFTRFGPLELPAEPAPAFRALIGKVDGSDLGDGIVFRLAVTESDGTKTVVAKKHLKTHAWEPFHADLSPWAGKPIRLELITDVGPDDNPNGDWAIWADMRVESAQPVLNSTLHDEPVRLRFEPGPNPATGLGLEELRKAKSGRLHFQAIGLQNDGQYISKGKLNGAGLGALPESGGDECRDVWADASIALSPEAIASLDAINHFEIDNPGRDCFKLRHVWIELELPDGRVRTSKLTTSTFTQPPDWLYNEGILVPWGELITVELRF